MMRVMELRPVGARPLPALRPAALRRARPSSCVVRASGSDNETMPNITEPTVFYGGKSFTEKEVTFLATLSLAFAHNNAVLAKALLAIRPRISVFARWADVKAGNAVVGSRGAGEHHRNARSVTGSFKAGSH